MNGILENLFQSLKGAAAQPVPTVPPAQNPVLTQPSVKGVSQMGVPQTGFFGTVPRIHNNAENIAAYARRYPWLAPYISDQNKLMQYIDAQTKIAANQSMGSQYDNFAANSAKTVLADIYGINDYTPKGFLKYQESPGVVQKIGGGETYSETGGWVDPRPFPQIKK